MHQKLFIRDAARSVPPFRSVPRNGNGTERGAERNGNPWNGTERNGGILKSMERNGTAGTERRNGTAERSGTAERAIYNTFGCRRDL